MKRGVLFGLLAIMLAFCIGNAVYAEGYELPLYNPDLMTFFSSESRYAQTKTMEYPEDLFQFGSGGWFDDIEGNKILEVTTGFIFPINEYVAVPIHFSVLSNSPAMTYFPLFWPIDPTHFEMFTGSGVIINTKWLTLGTYVGYHGLTLYDSSNYSRSAGDAFRVIGWPSFTLPVLSKSHGIDYSIVPVIKPNLGYLKRIESFFSTGKFVLQSDSKEESSFDIKNFQFYAKLVIDGFYLFNQNRNSIEPYYSRGNYDWKTKNNIYGLRLGLSRFVFEGGYRVFDATYDDSFFLAGQYRFPAPGGIQRIFRNEECFVSFSMDSNYKRFGIGISDQMSQIGGNGITMLEVVLNRENEFSIAFTEKVYMNWSKYPKR